MPTFLCSFRVVQAAEHTMSLLGVLEAQAAARFTSARDLVVVLDARIERVLETLCR